MPFDWWGGSEDGSSYFWAGALGELGSPYGELATTWSAVASALDAGNNRCAGFVCVLRTDCAHAGVQGAGAGLSVHGDSNRAAAGWVFSGYIAEDPSVLHEHGQVRSFSCSFSSCAWHFLVPPLQARRQDFRHVSAICSRVRQGHCVSAPQPRNHWAVPWTCRLEPCPVRLLDSQRQQLKCDWWVSCSTVPGTSLPLIYICTIGDLLAGTSPGGSRGGQRSWPRC